MNRFASLAAVLAMTCAHGTLAQTQPVPRSPALTTPPVAPPVTTTPAPATPPSQAPALAPPQAASIRLSSARIEVIGGLPALAKDERSIVAPLEGADIALSQVFDAAAAIEALYERHGYILVRAVVPPQDFARTGSTVRINVVGGRVAGIDVSALPKRVRGVVARHLARIDGKAWLKRSELERALLLAGDVSGIGLHTAIAPGSQPGTVVVVVTGNDPALSISASIDNSVGSALGGSALTLSPTLHSVFGGGETLYGVVGGAPFDGFWDGSSPRRFAALGFVAPIGEDGLSFSVEGLIAETRPDTSAGVLATSSRYTRIAFKVSYPIIRSRARDLTIDGGIDLVDERQTARDFDTLLYRDRLRPLRIGLHYTERDATSSFALSGELSHGIAGLGARDQSDATTDAPVSRPNARADFTKLTASFDFVGTIAGPWSYAVNASGQVSLDGPLFASEEAAIAGPHALSGYDLGDLSGDDVAMARLELRRAFVFTRDVTVEPYAFGAGGLTKRLQPSALEVGTIQAASVGVGARLSTRIADRPVRLEGEIAKGFSDNLPNHWRFGVALSVAF